MDGMGAWVRLHANYSRRTLGRMFRVQRECMYPKPAKDVGQVRLAIMQWKKSGNRRCRSSEGDAKIPDLWRVSPLLEICPKDVKEQMVMRLDEIGENYEELQGESGLLHDEQGWAGARSPEGDSSADGTWPRERKRAVWWRLGRRGRSSRRREVSQLWDDGTLRERLQHER